MQENVAAVRQAAVIPLNYGGKTRQYRFFSPCGIRGPVPLVVMLHGAGDTSRGALMQTGWAAKAGREGFAVACPDALRPDPASKPSFRENPQMWNSGYEKSHAFEQGIDDCGFIQAVIEDAGLRIGVDAARVYIAGFSDGASMAFRCALRFPAQLAAVAPTAGNCWLPLENTALDVPLPLLYIAGSGDPLNPADGGTVRAPWGGLVYKPPTLATLSCWAALNGCNAKPRLRRLPGGVERISFIAGRGGAGVEYYLVRDMGHVWPGGCNRLPPEFAGNDSRALDATALIWEFFRAHKLTGVREACAV